MASRRKKVKLPPRWARVVVNDALQSDEDRDRVFDWLRQLHAWALVDEIDVFVRIERGALARMGAVWPARVRKAAEFGIGLSDCLSDVLGALQMFDMARRGSQGAKRPKLAEEQKGLLLAQLQGLMDRIYESQKVLDREALDNLAGIGGCDIGALMRYRSLSGVEAAHQIAWCVRRSLLSDIGNPFSLFATTVPKKRKLKQVGRDAPRTTQELDDDDRAILRAVSAGADYTGGVARAVGMSPSHMGKRKMDLKKWGLVEKARDWRLTSKGSEWLTDSQSPRFGDV